MVYETFYHILSSGENVKFTIQSELIKNETYFFATLINTDLEFYQKLSEIEKENYIGINATNGKQKTVYYKDPEKLKADIKKYYGDEWLETEI